MDALAMCGVFDLQSRDDVFAVCTLNPDLIGVDAEDGARTVRVRIRDCGVHGEELVGALSGGKRVLCDFWRANGTARTLRDMEQAFRASNDVTSPRLIKHDGPNTWIHEGLVLPILRWHAKVEVQLDVAGTVPDAELDVFTPLCFADVISRTEEQVVQVKELDDWAEGLGELCALSREFPGYARRLHLYKYHSPCAVVPVTSLDAVRSACDKSGVLVTWEVHSSPSQQ
eukprot:jgi/Mesvir1/20187/Mv13425-RA.1